MCLCVCVSGKQQYGFDTSNTYIKYWEYKFPVHMQRAFWSGSCWEMINGSWFLKFIFTLLLHIEPCISVAMCPYILCWFIFPTNYLWLKEISNWKDSSKLVKTWNEWNLKYHGSLASGGHNTLDQTTWFLLSAGCLAELPFDLPSQPDRLSLLYMHIIIEEPSSSQWSMYTWVFAKHDMVLANMCFNNQQFSSEGTKLF